MFAVQTKCCDSWKLSIIRSCDWRAVADRSAISWGPIGNWLAISCRLFLERMFTVTKRSKTVWRPVDNWSAISRGVKTVLRLSATSRRPVPDLLATTKNLFTIDLVTERFHLQQAKPLCDQIILATFLHRPCDRPIYWSQGGHWPIASYVWPRL